MKFLPATSSAGHCLWLCAALLGVGPVSAASIDGHVLDPNGKPLPGIQVVYQRGQGVSGATAVTVFSGADGRFNFPGDYAENVTANANIRAQGLGFKQVDRLVTADRAATHLTFVLQPTANQADTAPASAWLGRIGNRDQQAAFIMNCIDCHQVPSREVRNYAALIDDLQAADPHEARAQSWTAIVQYMNFLSAWEFGRGRRSPDEVMNPDAVYSVKNGGQVATVLADTFVGRLDHLENYHWGAPLIATGNTAIWEYEVPEPNNIREAVLMGDPARLWAADVGANRIVSIDVATGGQKDYPVPTDFLIGPHSLHRDDKDLLWITPLFNSTVARLDPATGQWKTWVLKTPEGRSVGIHDLSFGYQHELLADRRGRVWFSDIGNAGVGYFDPANGKSRVWSAPIAAARAKDVALSGSASIYGLVMTRDRKEVWYSQLGNGVFGGFNVETEKFIGPYLLPSANAGPRRITISDEDVMYLALYGTGQLAEFDIKTRKMIAIHDLPDTASAPYSATWDPVRKVVWVATSNGNVIYRFDPRTKTFGVLPLPRGGAFLRMIDIDPQTGVLVSSYSNIVEVVHGPRMAFIVDPGDGAYPKKFSPTTASAARATR
jgi:streptogramin lyase